MSGIKLRLIEPGFEGYNGQIQGYEFFDGVSVELTQRQADRLAGILRVEVVDSDAKVGAGRMIGIGDLSVPPEAEVKAAAEQSAKVNTPIYSREQLEAIADKDGINGLREVGAEFGVKGRGIQELIADILKTQG